MISNTHVVVVLRGGRLCGRQGGISQYGGNSGAPLRGATKHLTEVMLRRGIASRGDELRARVLVQKLLNGEGIHFGEAAGWLCCTSGSCSLPFTALVQSCLARDSARGHRVGRIQSPLVHGFTCSLDEDWSNRLWYLSPLPALERNVVNLVNKFCRVWNSKP